MRFGGKDEGDTTLSAYASSRRLYTSESCQTERLFIMWKSFTPLRIESRFFMESSEITDYAIICSTACFSTGLNLGKQQYLFLSEICWAKKQGKGFINEKLWNYARLYFYFSIWKIIFEGISFFLWKNNLSSDMFKKNWAFILIWIPIFLILKYYFIDIYNIYFFYRNWPIIFERPARKYLRKSSEWHQILLSEWKLKHPPF